MIANPEGVIRLVVGFQLLVGHADVADGKDVLHGGSSDDGI